MNARRDRARQRRPGRLPIGLIGMLGLVLAVEGRLAGRADRLTTYQALGARFAAARAGRDAPGCGVLGLGDSVMKFGFDPAEVERRLGLRAYNLAVPGTPPPLSFALLRRALEAGARPKAVVVGHLTLAGDPGAHADEFGEVLGPADCLELAWVAADPDLFATLTLARLLPSLRYRRALRGVILAGLRGGAGAGAGPGGGRAAGFLRQWAAHRGMEPRPEGGRFDGRIEPGLERTLFAEPWRVLWVYEHYVRRISALAASHDVPVFWLVAPIAPEAQDRRDAMGLDALHTRNLRAILARTPNLVLLDARHAGYPASAFFDSCHLNARGASQLTTKVADAIAARLPDAPRWVALPPLEADPARVAAKTRDPARPAVRQ